MSEPTDLVDGTQPVRDGERVDARRLAEFLDTILNDGATAELVIEQFPRGFSNLTYLVRRGDDEFVMRRPPFGNRVKGAHDMGREFRVLSKLCDAFSPAPRPIVYCDDESVIGAPFYIMERRRGLVLRGNELPEGILHSPADIEQLSVSFVRGLSDLHRLDYVELELESMGRPSGYVQRQIDGWTRRLDAARTSEVEDLDAVADWLQDNQPSESRAALIHNDFKYDNLILDPADPTQIVAVLDWEMATIGDPLMDLGTTLAYWIQADDPSDLRGHAFGPTMRDGSLTRTQLVRKYEDFTGTVVPSPHFYLAYGFFKLAVILQQIYARFVRGHTQDPRFAHLDHLVRTVARRGAETVESERL